MNFYDDRSGRGEVGIRGGRLRAARSGTGTPAPVARAVPAVPDGASSSDGAHGGMRLGTPLARHAQARAIAPSSCRRMWCDLCAAQQDRPYRCEGFARGLPQRDVHPVPVKSETQQALAACTACARPGWRPARPGSIPSAACSANSDSFFTRGAPRGPPCPNAAGGGRLRRTRPAPAGPRRRGGGDPCDRSADARRRTAARGRRRADAERPPAPYDSRDRPLDRHGLWWPQWATYSVFRPRGTLPVISGSRPARTRPGRADGWARSVSAAIPTCACS